MIKRKDTQLIVENWRRFISEVKEINIKYTKPLSNDSLDREWEEAKTHHSDDFTSKEDWLKKVKDGEEFDITGKDISINNTQYAYGKKEQMEKEYKNLTGDRQDRIKDAFSAGEVELPIVKKKNNEYTLIAGNTRLTRMGIENCKNEDFPVKVWLIDLD